jgi:two-component system CheB/CheR fusion protein
MASVFHIQTQDIGRSIRHFSHNLKRAGVLEDIERALHDGIVYEDEVRDSDGTTYFLRILPYRAAAQAEPAGSIGSHGTAPRIEGVVMSLTDISALDRVRSKLRQLSAIVEFSDDAIIGATLDGAITSWNRGAERLYKYSPDEAIGRNISMLAPSGADEMKEFLEAFHQGRPIDQVETMHLRKDGSIVDVSITFSPVYDAEGNITGASAIARNITQLKTAQRDLTEREARIRLLLDSTAEAIFGLGPDGLCTFVNPACVRMLGYTSADDLIGRHIHPLIHPAHPEEECQIYSVLHTGRGAHSDEEVLWRSDGTTFVSEYWSYPIRRAGRTAGVVVTFVDITDRKRAEEEIRTAARRREEFLAMLSHELRNPLSAVVSAARVMRSENVKPIAIDRAREIVERQSRHMARLLDDLLDVSRITRGGIELRKEDVDLRDIIQTAVESLTPLLEDRRCQLALDLADEVLPIRGDSARIQQVVVNLLSNAARYSPSGKTIRITAGHEGETIILKVKDEGRGISRSMLSEIFELFVQDGQGLERSSGGLGIGLTLVRQIVELHGGKVEAHSDGPGTGSEFVVSLPRQPNALLRWKQGEHEASAARRVLIVEDQDDAREMLRVLLQSMGHIVVEQPDGGSAVEAIRREHPDVALIDIGLPIKNGYEVAREIRQNPLLDDIVLVALTGYGMDTDIEAAKASGFDEHMTKPADAQLINEILTRRMRGQKAS